MVEPQRGVPQGGSVGGGGNAAGSNKRKRGRRGGKNHLEGVMGKLKSRRESAAFAPRHPA